MDIEYRNGLLFTSIQIFYQGKSEVIDKVIVDTGAAQTLISQDCVDHIGIRVTGEDQIVTSFGIGGKEFAFVKIIDQVKIGDFEIEHIPLDFATIDYDDIHGLLGLDILLRAGFVIDLKKMMLYR